MTAVQPDTDLVTVNIDGTDISVPKGTLVIRAAELIGVQIPRFCDHPLLDPVGACRQCLVEVEGQRKPLAACTTTVADEMVVRTQITSAAAQRAQSGVMELLLINHPWIVLFATRAESARCRTRRCPPVALKPGSPRPNALSLSRFRCPPRCCWTGSDVCCARAAPGFPNKSPVIRSSSCWNVVRCNRLASPAMSPSSRTSPAIPCRSAP